MKRDSFKLYLHWGLTAFCVIALSILFFFSLFRVDALVRSLRAAAGVLMPFVFGGVIAYLLNPLFNRIYALVLPFLRKRSKKPLAAARTAKALSTALSVLIALLLVGALFSMVLPQVITSVIGLVESNLLPDSIQRVTEWFDKTLRDNPGLEAAAQQVYSEAVGALTAWVKADMLPQLTNLVNGLMGTLNFAKNLLIGVIIAIYILNSKRLFAAQGKKLLYSLFGVRRTNFILDNLRFTDRVFGGFLGGKVLDSIIIGILCFIGMSILGMPYTMLISVVIGITNIIPFFGPFIGAVPSTLLILLIDPLKALYFVIFILVLQQFDGNILGPKILGQSTGLSSFWVMFALLVGGGLFGIVGMLVGVPLFAVLYSLISGLICRSLRQRSLPEDTLDYFELDHIDEKTRTIVPFGAEADESDEADGPDEPDKPDGANKSDRSGGADGSDDPAQPGTPGASAQSNPSAQLRAPDAPDTLV